MPVTRRKQSLFSIHCSESVNRVCDCDSLVSLQLEQHVRTDSRGTTVTVSIYMLLESDV